MPSPALSFSKIGPESDAVLRDLLQRYIRDMAEWFEVETNPNGSYSYDTPAIWQNGYDVYLAKAGDAVAGFALVGSAEEWLGEAGGWDVHEFLVDREFRRSGVGKAMAKHIWNKYLGEWLVRVLEANAPACAFWRAAIAACCEGRYQEERRVVQGRTWVFLHFQSRGHV